MLLKDIFIRKKVLADQFKIDLNLYFVDNIQFANYPEGILNGLDLIFENNNLTVVPSNSKSFALYKKIDFLIAQLFSCDYFPLGNLQLASSVFPVRKSIEGFA